MNAYQLWKSTEGLTEKDRLRKLYEHQIVKYEGEELSERHWLTKRDNIDGFKKALHKARYNLTRTKTLLTNLDKPPIIDYSI